MNVWVQLASTPTGVGEYTLGKLKSSIEEIPLPCSDSRRDAKFRVHLHSRARDIPNLTPMQLEEMLARYCFSERSGKAEVTR